MYNFISTYNACTRECGTLIWLCFGINICKKGGQGSNICETQLSLFKKIKNQNKQTMNVDKFKLITTIFYQSQQCSANKNIRDKHALLALNCVLVYHCQHINGGKSRDIIMAAPRDIIMAAPIN